jgi:transcriptional regulator of aromatic amino acid metabolism
VSNALGATTAPFAGYVRKNMIPNSVLIGSRKKLRPVVEGVRTTAAVDRYVLDRGETGTGKEIVAGGIHSASPRRQRRFIPVNCSPMPAPLLQSELFGRLLILRQSGVELRAPVEELRATVAELSKGLPTAVARKLTDAGRAHVIDSSNQLGCWRTERCSRETRAKQNNSYQARCGT